MDKERDLQNKLRLQEKIKRELDEHKRKVLEQSEKTEEINSGVSSPSYEEASPATSRELLERREDYSN
jgi:hypothetical protein